MATSEKEAAVGELKQRFTNSSGAVLTDYRGLTVSALKELRRALGEDATYAVSKNTLTQIAAREAGIEGIDALLVGPTAIAFIDGDPVVVAKGLRDFAKANPLLVIKGGVLDGKVLSTDEVNKLADLESREVLLAKLAGAMKAAPQNLVSLLAAPLAQAARALGALQTAASDNPAIIGGTGEEPQATDTQHQAAPVADDTAAGGGDADAADHQAADAADHQAADAAEEK